MIAGRPPKSRKLPISRRAEQEEPGFWETHGYHLRGDPWKEERYALAVTSGPAGWFVELRGIVHVPPASAG